MSRIEFWLRLYLMKGSRLKKLRRLQLNEPLSPYAIVQLLHIIDFDQNKIADFYRQPAKVIDMCLKWLELPHHHIITYDDAKYPPLLKHISDPPILLFVQGSVALLHKSQIAMVGSRHHSHYGKQWGSYFATELSAAGVVITSGLAVGIDGICHQAVVEQKRQTVAVLGSGFNHLSPKQHTKLAERILQYQGTIISEFLPNEPPYPQHFPKRNRIISGLSQGVIVVEATLKSGSLITARLALEQGRDVFAIPGPLGNPSCEGTHQLIQQGALLITTPKDVLDYLQSTLNWLDLPAVDDSFSETEKNELKATELLPFPELLSNVGDEVTPIDIIANRMSCPIAEVAVQLLELELAGYVSSVGGGYIRLRHPKR